MRRRSRTCQWRTLSRPRTSPRRAPPAFPGHRRHPTLRRLRGPDPARPSRRAAPVGRHEEHRDHSEGRWRQAT
eukprot:847239-Alexandrium_andersonii.AAC.1